MNHRREPSVEQLWIAPELASLAVLEAAIDIAILAMVAVHPEIQDPDRAEQTASLRAANIIIEDARALTAAIARYQLILRRVPDRVDDMPF